MNDILFELNKFIKKYFKMVIISTLVMSLGVFSLFFLFKSYNFSDTLENSDTGLYDDGDAVISIFVEEEDGRTFENTAIIEQYLRTEASLKKLSNETNTDIDQYVKEERELVNITGEDNDRVLTTNKNPYSGLMEIIVSTEDPETNIIIGEYISRNLPEILPFLQNKNVYSVGDNPLIINELDSSENNSNNNVLSLRTLLLLVLTILFIALFICVLIAIYEFFSEIITFKYTLSIYPEDFYLLTSTNGYNSHLTNLFFYNSFNNEQYAIIDSIVENRFYIDNFNIKVITNIEEIDNNDNIKEVIIVIYSGETRRSWYNKVREYLSYRKNIRIKIIQIN